MTNFYINNLPPPKKNRLEQVVKFLFAKNILEAAIFTYSLLAVGLLWSWLVLQETFSDLSASALSINREYSTFNQEIREVNKIIKAVTLSARDYVAVTPRLVEFINSVPNDIKINSIAIDHQSKTFAVFGTAKTREALLRYQELIKSFPWLSPSESPLSQLWQRENINFELNLRIRDSSPLKL